MSEPTYIPHIGEPYEVTPGPIRTITIPEDPSRTITQHTEAKGYQQQLAEMTAERDAALERNRIYRLNRCDYDIARNSQLASVTAERDTAKSIAEMLTDELRKWNDKTEWSRSLKGDDGEHWADVIARHVAELTAERDDERAARKALMEFSHEHRASCDIGFSNQCDCGLVAALALAAKLP